MIRSMPRAALNRVGAPALTAAFLVAMLFLGGGAPFRTSPEIEAYFARVKATIEAVPHQSGPWLGIDIPATPAAVEMLQPNKLIQRRYTHADTGEWFELLIVHCGDVRDMIGHYPPVCYPAHGWTLGPRRVVEIGEGRTATRATSYTLSRDRELTRESIVIIGLFALPAPEGETLGHDLAHIERAGRFRERARLGAAQVQVITPFQIDEGRREQIIGTAISLVGDVLHEIGKGLK